MSAPPIYPEQPDYPEQQPPYQPTATYPEPQQQPHNPGYQPYPGSDPAAQQYPSGGAAPPVVQGGHHQPAPVPYNVHNSVQPYFSASPAPMTCPHCREDIVTKVTHSIGKGSILICIALFFLTGQYS
eukprot:sb/3475459/